MKLLLSIVYIAILGVISHYIGESLPRSFFNPDSFPYKTFSFEKNGMIYEKTGIKKWKNKLPDMSLIMRDMIPKRITRHSDIKSVSVLIKETCVAEFIHYLLCILAFGIYFIWKNTIGFLLTALYIFCNLPFIIIQRYNRPHLTDFLNRLILREEKHQSASSDIIL